MPRARSAKSLDSPFVRRSFARYRLGGVASLAIPRAWLRILGPSGGAPQILDPIAQQNRTLAAFIRLQNSFDVKVGDILKESSPFLGRIFVVGQVQPEPGKTNLLHCSEIRAPIPDEFNAQSLEAFWTQTTSGFSASSDGPSEPVLLLSSMPSGTLPSAAKGNYQLVSGDFDVWARLRADVGSVGNVRYVLVGARRPSDNLGCYVGVRDDGSKGEFVRLDEYAASTLDTTTGAQGAVATLYYVRLKRTGSRFQVFYKATQNAPAIDSDWVEIANDPSTSFSAVEDLRVGCWGYTNNSTSGQALWAFFRNWTGQGPEAQPVGTTTAFSLPWFIPRPDLAVFGAEDFHSVVAPDGQALTLTQVKIKYSTGSHTPNINISFAPIVRRASDNWATPISVASILLDNTNNTIHRVYTVQINPNVTLNPGDTLSVIQNGASGTVTERNVTVSVLGFQKVQ